MSDTAGTERRIVCREARKRFAELDNHESGSLNIAERAAINYHVQTCPRCSMEYRLFALQRATLDLASSEPFSPDEEFFKGVRARIARGPEPSHTRQPDESWAAALFVTARQLVPAMAVLLLLMLGATLFWNRPSQLETSASVRPRERVMFPDMYDYPEPTQDDVLETLVAIEEK
jgi:anti-sigma factor RsiW